MAAPTSRGAFLRAHRAGILRVGAFVAGIAVLATVAIVAQGFDVKQAPLTSSTIWAINQSANDPEGVPRYARVNTQLKELDTVKPAALPSSIVQTTASVVLMTNSDGKYLDVNQADPQELKQDSKELKSAPTGTPKHVVSTADYVGYLSDGGSIFVGQLGDAGLADPVAVDPYADQSTDAPGKEAAAYVAAAITIGTTGVLYAYSADRGSVVGYDLHTGKRVSDDPITVPDSVLDTLQLTSVGSTWVLFNGTNRIWTADAANGTGGAIPGATDGAAALLQAPAADGDTVAIATTTGLYGIPLDGGDVTTLFGGDGTLGTPAQPMAFRDRLYGAWLPATVTTGGTLWSSARPNASTPLPYGTIAAGAATDPVFRNNGGTMILNDDASGWVWTVPDGAIVPSSQDWTAGESKTPESDPTKDTAQDVVEPKPPVAVDDSFGVRPGQLVALPVLLNDSDPNSTDVLTIATGSIAGLDESFGTAVVTTNDQRIAIRVADGATGADSFRYSVTDGTSKSEATVTLDVAGEGDETAPVWCGDWESGCTQTWPILEVTPGASGSVNVIDQWVDPEGDALYVKSVGKKNDDDRGNVGLTQDGRVFFQDDKPNDTAGGQVTLEVVVADAFGQSTEKDLAVTVTAQPTIAALPMAVTTHVGDALTIDPTDYVSGVSGVYTITQATPSTQTATASPDSAATGIDFTATKAGMVTVRYDLTDTSGQALSSTVRVTVLDDDDATLTVSPITVFVRPNLDTTVDVFSAVSNPADKLLIVTSAVENAAAQEVGSNSLHADVVGSGLVRVTGSTADGQPGLVGRVVYTVTDGGDGAGSSVEGVATVVLLPEQAELAPIAVNDSVTVRAGAQVDIPVLANDVSADGGAMVLNPDPDTLSSTADTAGGLAFVSGSTLRFLAPQQDGVYTIGYQVYAAGAPTKFGSGTVQVTVTRPGANQEPRPKPLQARVVAGQSVLVPFDDYGIDPDGDTVILDRITKQPEHGAATISVRGDEINFTAFPGYTGTDVFEYQVKDPDGKLGVSTVSVGIIGSDTGSTPITYTDYVEVQAGADNVVDIFPAANDVDPLGKPLTVTALTPFATAGPEYDALDALITKAADGTAVVNNKVQIRAGADVGTRTYSYTVTDGLNPNVGYIVLNVVDASVPDVPRVTDSYVSVNDRATFASQGIDVVSGKVSWLSGDASKLTMTLVDPPVGYTQSGSRISGPLPTAGSVLLAFKVTGTSSITKKPVFSYGFLRIPGPDDIILSLRADAPKLSVNENGAAISFDMNDYVSLPAGATLVVEGPSVARVVRTDATCTFQSGTTISYTPNAGSPYTDACLVPVKFDFQKEFTPVLVAITVVPEKPVPSFNSASLSGLLPGVEKDVHTLDLATMVTWDGPEDNANLQFTADAPSSKNFEFSIAGSVISVRAKGGVAAGTKDVIRVHFAGAYASVTDAGTVNLTTAAAPPSFPRGGSTSATCRISDGKCAAVTVIGLPGEVNTVGDGDLVVVASTGQEACAGISFTVQGKTRIVASWSGFPDGLECSTSFVVQDPNGFKSSGDRNGTIHWTFEGLPREPASVTQTSYDDGRVTLAIDPGKASAAFPKLTGFVIRQDGDKKTVATCNAGGVCPAITGLENLQHHQFSAYAVNSEGEESQKAATVEAWSYAKPTLGAVTVTSIYDPSWTDAARGPVRIVIAGSEKSVSAYKISGADDSVARTGGSTTVTVDYKVGSTTIKIVPITSSDPPKASGPTADDAADSYTVKVASLPSITNSGSADAKPDRIVLNNVGVDRNNSDKPLQIVYAAYKATAPTCAVDATGGNPVFSGGDGPVTNSSTIAPVDANETYQVFACASNGYGFAVTQKAAAFTGLKPTQRPNLSYTVSPVQTAANSGQWKLTLNEALAASRDPKFEAQWSNWDPGTHTAAVTNDDPNISVKYCLKTLPTFCGDSTTIEAAPGSALWQVQVDGTNAITCVAKEKLSGFSVGSMTDLGSIDVDQPVKYYTDLGVEIIGSSTDTVPETAFYVSNVHATLTWKDDQRVARLTPYGWTVLDDTKAACSGGKPTATSTPTSTPTDTPSSTPTDTPSSTPSSTPTDTPTATDSPTSAPG